MIAARPNEKKKTRSATIRPGLAVPARLHLGCDSEGCPRARQSVPCPVLHTGSHSPRYCHKHTSPQITFHYHIPSFHGFSVPHTSERSHTQAAPSMSAVSTHPRGFSHMSTPFPHTSPQIPQPHTPCADPHRFSWLTMHFHGSHIQSTSSKNLTLVSTRPAFPAPQTRRRSGLHEFPAPTVGAVPHVRAGHQSRRDQRSVHSNLRVRPVHADSPI